MCRVLPPPLPMEECSASVLDPAKTWLLTRISPWQAEPWGKGAKDFRILCWSCDKLKWLLGFMRCILMVVYANREHKHHTCSLASQTFDISNHSFYPAMGKKISLKFDFMFSKEKRLGSSIQSFVSFSYEVTDELFGPYLIFMKLI